MLSCVRRTWKFIFPHKHKMARMMKKKSTPYKKRRVARRRVVRRTANVPEWATLSETNDFGSLNVGSFYNVSDIQLAQFPRAASVAQGYAQFRITSLKFTYQPLLDTFPSTGGTQVPYLVWKINREANAPAGITYDWFLQNGAKLLRFDDKSVIVRYKPSVIFDTVEAGLPGVGNQAAAPKTMQWLSTNRDPFAPGFAPSQTSHAGHLVLVSSPGSADPMSYRMTVTAEFQFRKPLARIPTSTDAGYIPVTPLTLH